jgi:CRP/FNR family transcriptional regulator
MQPAFQAYINSVRYFCPAINADEMSYLEKGLTITQLSARQFYHKAEKVPSEIGFVYTGLLRTFYMDEYGNEITVRFCKENDYATDYHSFITQQPGKYFIQCIEPSIIVNLSYTYIQEGYKKRPVFERYGRLIAEEVIKAQQKRIEGFLFENAESRYLQFIKENGDLFNRVSLSYLSSYLGIERPSLSRIRKKLAGV